MTDNTSGLIEEIGILQADNATCLAEIERLTAELAASRAKVDELKRNGDELLAAFRYACKVRDDFEADTTRLLGQIADMTRRKDGWRGVALMYRGEVRRLVDSLIDRMRSSNVETWFRVWSRLRKIKAEAQKKSADNNGCAR